MNKQDKGNGRRGIEWTDYTWNPVQGCKHGCTWNMPDGSTAECYAKSIADTMRSEKFFPRGFDAHYFHEDRLDEPLKLKTPARIFLDSMSDLLGHWVPADQIEQVLDVCRRADWHSFQLLTKNPQRLKTLHFPPNVWVGASVPPSAMFGKPLTQLQQVRLLDVTLDALAAVNVPVRWISFEPLSFDVSPYIRMAGLQWAVIGAATNGTKVYQPRPEWVRGALAVLDQQGAKVFFKGNLQWTQWREEFPTTEQRAVQLNLFD